MAEMLTTIDYSITGIMDAAQQLLSSAKGNRILTFSGGLGAGKTTFITALCRQLGVQDHVSSPTFSLINEYRFVKEGKEEIIYHMDWYRLRDTEEAINSGMEDCLLKSGVYCFVEWPEQAPELLTMPHLFMTIEPTEDESRKLVAEQRP